MRSVFQNWRLQSKFFQELVLEMDNTDQSKISRFIKLVWEQHIQLAFGISIRRLSFAAK